jgi:predicted aconitase
MTVQLSDGDRRTLDGERGEAARMAMSIVVRMAEVVEAGELMDVTQAHIDGCGLLSDAGLEFAETLAANGGRVVIPTTLNMGPLDLQNWREFGVDEAFAAKAVRQADAYTQMGCIPTWTCAPYQGYLTPRFGQQIAWGESNAIAYANSVLGARTNRYGDYIDICAAITGRVPKCGLHLDANRRGQILLRLVGFDADLLASDVFYPVLGHLLGPMVGEKIPVIDGLPPTATDDQLKAFGAAAASAGAVALFHAVGVTPEAPDLPAAFQGGEPERIVDVTPADWQEARANLSTAEEGAAVDAVVLGCPHYSFAEFRRLVEAVRAEGGRAVHPNVQLIVITGQSSHALVQRTGWLDELARFGARITRDTCVFHTPLIGPEARVIMTDSGKCAYYAPGELNVRVAFGSAADCVRSAVEGRVCRREP